MKRTIARNLLVSAALVGFMGCASDQGQKIVAVEQPTPSQPVQPAKPPKTRPPKTRPLKDKRPKEERLSVGMTKDQVIEAIGRPKGTAMNSDGTETWVYSDTEKAFIPYYSLGGGKFYNLVVVFDPTGKVKSWSSYTQGGY